MINKLHLHMFDEGVAMGSASSGSAAIGSASAGGSEAGTQVVYGKEEPQAGNNDLANHGSGEAGQPGVETPDLTAEFNDLIAGKYKDQFGAKMQEAIQNRFKNSADYEGQVKQYADAVAPLMQMYGLKAGDIEGLTNAIQSDDGLLAQKADAEGLTVEKYRQQLKLEMEAARGRDIEEAIANEREQREMFARWDQEADQLKTIFPNFDLGIEIEHTPGFVSYLENGLSVEDAFFLTHKGDILNGASAQTAQQTQAKTIQNFQTRAARPVENGLSSGPTVVRKADPSKFDKEDVMEVIRQARAGKKITF